MPPLLGQEQALSGNVVIPLFISLYLGKHSSPKSTHLFFWDGGSRNLFYQFFFGINMICLRQSSIRSHNLFSGNLTFFLENFHHLLRHNDVSRHCAPCLGRPIQFENLDGAKGHWILIQGASGVLMAMVVGLMTFVPGKKRPIKVVSPYTCWLLMAPNPLFA